jgi:hypothetical protein
MYMKHEELNELMNMKQEEIIKDSHQITTHSINEGATMNKLSERAVLAELAFRNRLITIHDSFFARLKDERGDVPGWVLVVLMTTGLVTAIWTIAAPRLTAILKDSLDSMNGIR